MRTFQPHQQLACDYARSRDKIALFMQMRLGKTMVAIRWTEENKEGLVLVVCPLSVMNTWQRELELEGLSCTLLVGPSATKRSTLLSNKNRWVIVNPEGVRACKEILTDHPWMTVICDESTFLKNPRAKITKLFRKCRAERRAILTGMPNPEGLADFFEQMAFLFDEFMGHQTFWTWRQRFMFHAGFGWEVKRPARTEILNAVKKSAFVMSAAEAGVKMKRVHETRMVHMPPNVRRIYRQVCLEYRCGESMTKWTLASQIWLAKLCAGLVPEQFDTDKIYYDPFKVNEIISLFNGELKGSKAVIFCRFTREVNLVYRQLVSHGFSAIFMVGVTPLEDRRKIIDQFNDPAGNLQLIVCQEQKVGEKGVNFSAADTLIFSSNHWSWEMRSQCEARADHPMKKTPTLILDIVTDNTIDKVVVTALTSKKIESKHFLQQVMRAAREEGLV